MDTFTTHTTTPNPSTSTRPIGAPTPVSAPALRLLPGGLAPWDLRRARPRDEQAVVALYDRLSTESRYRRFHGIPGDRVVRAEAERVAHCTDGDWSWVAATYDGTVVGVVRLVRAADGSHEIAVVVDDDWHGRGVGGRLVRWALASGARAGVRSVIARVQGDNTAALGLFRSLPGARAAFDDGEILVTVPTVAPARPAADDRRGAGRLAGRRWGRTPLSSEAPATGAVASAALRRLA